MDVTSDLLLDMYRHMIKVRYFEEKCVKMMQKNLFPGRVHSYIGQETIAVGACLALQLMIPVFFVIITVLVSNFLRDGLRDAADPYR